MNLNKELIDFLREKYKKGTRLELIAMNDPQAPPKGTQGTVIGVDSWGSIMVNWDNGCGLSVVYGEDRCRII